MNKETTFTVTFAEMDVILTALLVASVVYEHTRGSGDSFTKSLVDLKTKFNAEFNERAS